MEIKAPKLFDINELKISAIEKAKQLVGKYKQQYYVLNNLTFSDQLAAKCAIIATDEVISQWEYISTYLANGMGEFNPNLQYWIEVRRELTQMI